jgi:hypothetical protein
MNKKMLLVSLGALALIILVIMIKQGLITAQRGRKVISTFTEWQEKGKPVVVTKVVKSNVDVYTKISVVRSSGNDYETFVPRSTLAKLKPGQSFYIAEGGGKIQGTVADVDQELDMDSGMFRVRLSFENGNTTEQETLMAYINTGVITDVICVPNSAVDRQGDQNVLWIAEGDYAHQRNVVIKQRNGYGSIIDQGLEEGEILILQGITHLQENDKLNILNRSDVSLGASNEGVLK